MLLPTSIHIFYKKLNRPPSVSAWSLALDHELPKRLVSLDIFRGVTIAGMIVVNNLKAWTDTPRFPRLSHAQWHGCTLADLIFPLFIFIVGVSTVFAIGRRVKAGERKAVLYKHVLSRTLIIFLLGLISGSYFLIGWLLQSICPPAVTQESIWSIFFSPPAASEAFYFSLANLRIMGVLQRIALVYLVVSILLLHTGWRFQAALAAALLLSYWALMTLIPGFPLEPGEDLGALLDRTVFGEQHLWRFTRTWDPEGLFSTLPAIATGLCGALTGEWLSGQRDHRDTLIGIFIFGFFGILIGALWGFVFPLNKYLWTSSYAVYTAGFGLMFLGFWYWLTDLEQANPPWAWPFVWLGMNPILAYCGAQIGAVALGALYIGTPGSHTHLFTLITDPIFGANWDVAGLTKWRDPRWPSLYWALIYLSFWTLLSGLLYRRRIFLKI